MIFAERLKLIREERGLSLEKFAQLGGVQARTQIYYEKSERYPTVEYLLKLSDAGIDIAYLVTGSISPNDLTKDENELLSAYRSSSSEKKYALMLMARAIEKFPDEDNDMGKPIEKSSTTQKLDKESDQDNISLYKKADRTRNLSSFNKVILPFSGIALLICFFLVMLGEYSYLFSEDLFTASIFSLSVFSVISIGMILIAITYAEKVFNIKDSNVARIRKIKALFISK